MGKSAVYNKIFIIIGIILLPLILMIVNASISTLFYLGQNVGTFIRYLFQFVGC